MWFQNKMINKLKKKSHGLLQKDSARSLLPCDGEASFLGRGADEGVMG